jgi:hypothetical protein
MNPRTCEKGTTAFRLPESEGAWNLCLNRLAKLVGESEAVKPEWKRRMALSATGTPTPLVLISCCPWVSDTDPAHNCPWMQSETGFNPMDIKPLGFPLAEGVALLQSADNPEAETARRRGRLAWKAQRDADDRAAVGASGRAQAEAERVESDLRTRFGLDVWTAADPGLRALISLGEIITSAHPDLAVAIREAVGRAGTPSASPRDSLPRSTTWWKRPSAAELAAVFPAKE